jgi:hypothetical protein
MGNQKWTIQRNRQHRTHKTRKTNQKHNTICVLHHYRQTNTNNVNKTWDLLQTTGGKDEPNIRKPWILWIGPKTKLYLRKRKFKPWWSTITPISTKRTITSHLYSLNVLPSIVLMTIKQSLWNSGQTISNKLCNRYKVIIDKISIFCNQGSRKTYIHIQARTWISNIIYWGRHGHDRMVVGFTTTYLVNQCLSPLKLWVRIPLMRGILDTLCDKVCQWLATDQWFSLVSSTSKTDIHDIAGNIVESGVKHHKPTNPSTNHPMSYRCRGLSCVQWVMVRSDCSFSW